VVSVCLGARGTAEIAREVLPQDDSVLILRQLLPGGRLAKQLRKGSVCERRQAVALVCHRPLNLPLESGGERFAGEGFEGGACA
jgi:hypothetical protein